MGGEAGRYASPELGTSHNVRVEGERLVVSNARRGDDPLVAIREDEFASTLLDQVRVERDAAGAVTGPRSTTARTVGVWFEGEELGRAGRPDFAGSTRPFVRPS